MLRAVYSHIKAMLVAAVAGFLLVGAVAQSAALPYTYIETAVLPDLAKATDLAASKLVRNGSSWLLAAAREGRVFLYEVSDTNTAAYQELTGFPSRAVSMAFADYNGDGKDDLWVGSDGSGNIYVYSIEAGYPMLGKSTDRTWSKIVKLLTPDLNGDQFADALALTDAGTVFAFVRQESGLILVGSTGTREGKVQHLAYADLNNDGRDEVAMARGGYLAIWGWAPMPESTLQSGYADLAMQAPAPLLASASVWPEVNRQTVKSPVPDETMGKFTRLWEFDSPKGLISGLAACDVNGDKTNELLVTTSQSRTHVFSTDGYGSFVQRSDEEAGQLAAGYRTVLPSNGGSALLFGAIGDSLAIWRHKGGSAWQYETVWQSEFDLKFKQVIAAGDRLLVASSDGVHILKETPRDYVRVIVDGKTYNPSGLLANPVVLRGEVLLAAKDWATILNLPLPAWHPAGRLTMIQGLQYLIVTLGSKEAIANGHSFALRNEPRNIGGLVFLPAEAVSLITRGITWNPRTRTLSIDH